MHEPEYRSLWDEDCSIIDERSSLQDLDSAGSIIQIKSSVIRSIDKSMWVKGFSKYDKTVARLECRPSIGIVPRLPEWDTNAKLKNEGK